MVEADVSAPLPDEVLLTTPFHELISQKVTYEWIPYYCKECRKLGYTEDFCRVKKAKAKAKGTIVQVYRPVVAVASSGQASECAELGLNPSVGASSSSLGDGRGSGCSELGSSSLQGTILGPLVGNVGPGCQQLGSDTTVPEECVAGVKCIFRPKRSEAGADVSLSNRGLNDPLKQQGVRDFLLLNKVDVLGLLETHVRESNVRKITSSFSNYKITCNYQAHSNGRIWVFWSSRTVSMCNIVAAEQFIHCEVVHNASGQIFHATFVYGGNTAAERERLWNGLVQLSLSVNRWIVMGDFNIVRDIDERRGPNPPRISEIVVFNECIQDC
ncbi:hypothetical protein RND81_12G023000 [Saponaria officinalis]|uniref:Endonuclease/exonuclease/phosphatase domain-containing protein n=1 Tax=Saponaria officinalis TaxID=3572 RepID=A0AAW1H5B7_SAPOF